MVVHVNLQPAFFILRAFPLKALVPLVTRAKPKPPQIGLQINIALVGVYIHFLNIWKVLRFDGLPGIHLSVIPNIPKVGHI